MWRDGVGLLQHPTYLIVIPITSSIVPASEAVSFVYKIIIVDSIDSQLL